MLLLTPIYTWPQNLGLAQIEAIVQEIEQEKEAGKIKRLSYVPSRAHGVVRCRGGKKALEAGCHGSGTGGDDKPCRGCARIIGQLMAVLCNYMHHVALDTVLCHQNRK
jgi:hypothetical protein